MQKERIEKCNLKKSFVFSIFASFQHPSGHFSNLIGQRNYVSIIIYSTFSLIMKLDFY